MKKITSKNLRSIYETLIFITIIIGLLKRIWLNNITICLYTITSVLFWCFFIAALVKGWYETRSIRQVYKDNRLWIISFGVYAVLVLILIMLK